MRIKVLFFGFTHDLTGICEEQVELAAGQNLGYLKRLYEERFPRLSELADSLVVAVNQQIADRSFLLHEGDEVAFMPPVSGGLNEDFYRITREKILTANLAQSFAVGPDGARVVFEGVVRNESQGRKTLYLCYEAYESMAVRKMEEIGAELKEKFAIHNVGIIHRTGRLEIGETSVAIIVTAAHRGAAFEACRYAIDRLKQSVPIWKKEYFEDGAVWIEGENQKGTLVKATS
jgi:molybdopterin converting factor subunit 1